MRRTALMLMLATLATALVAAFPGPPVPVVGVESGAVQQLRDAQRSAAAQRAGRAERPVPFNAGETLVFDVSWTSFVTAGTVTVKVAEKRPSFGSVAYYITGEARPTPLLSRLYTLYYKVDTLLDAYTLLPQRGSVYSEESGRRRMKITRFNQTSRTAQFEMQTASVMKRDLAVPAFAQDPLSALFVIRALPLKPGAKVTMPICDGGSILRASITVGGREPVKTGLGTLQAIRVTPVVTDAQGRVVGRRMDLWITDDARKLPVQLRADLAVGSFNLILREARP